MRKTGRRPKLTLIAFAQLYAHPLTERGRTLPNVDSNVKHSAAHHAHQLALRLFNLIVQPAKHALTAPTVIILYKLMTGSGSFIETLLVETFVKKTTLIAEHCGLNDEYVWNGCWGDLHGARSAIGFSFKARRNQFPVRPGTVNEVRIPLTNAANIGRSQFC